jgi:hypothetical protein
MKKYQIIVLLCLSPLIAFSQQLGATFCWQQKEIEGGHAYSFNQSILKETISEIEWWENHVEEVDYAGLDYIALLSRGTTPGRKDRGMGDQYWQWQFRKNHATYSYQMLRDFWVLSLFSNNAQLVR